MQRLRIQWRVFFLRMNDYVRYLHQTKTLCEGDRVSLKRLCRSIGADVHKFIGEREKERVVGRERGQHE
jgi:hypothetical protein